MSDTSAGTPANAQPGPTVPELTRRNRDGSDQGTPGLALRRPPTTRRPPSCTEFCLQRWHDCQRRTAEPRASAAPVPMLRPSVEAAQHGRPSVPHRRTPDRYVPSRPARCPDHSPAAAPERRGRPAHAGHRAAPPGQGQRRPSRAKQAVPEAGQKTPGSRRLHGRRSLTASSSGRRPRRTEPACPKPVRRPTQGRRRSGRERRGKPVGRYLMCVHVRPHATQIAVLEGRTLVEHFVSRASDDTSQIDGNIYLGRVQNVLPGMEAAFVDIATPKNAVLYRGRRPVRPRGHRDPAARARCGSSRC